MFALTPATAWRKSQLNRWASELACTCVFIPPAVGLPVSVSLIFMATTTKKPPKKQKAKPRSPSSKKSQPKQPQTIEGLRHELAEALEQQAATSGILRMIARSPGDLQSVIDAIAENAARLCDASDALVWRIDGAARQLVSHFGATPTVDRLGERQTIDHGTAAGRAVIDRKTIHVHDLLAGAGRLSGRRNPWHCSRTSHRTRHAVASRWHCHWGNHDSPT
jgi:hypothetical protein